MTCACCGAPPLNPRTTDAASRLCHRHWLDWLAGGERYAHGLLADALAALRARIHTTEETQ